MKTSHARLNFSAVNRSPAMAARLAAALQRQALTRGGYLRRSSPSHSGARDYANIVSTQAAARSAGLLFRPKAGRFGDDSCIAGNLAPSARRGQRWKAERVARMRGLPDDFQDRLAGARGFMRGLADRCDERGEPEA